jgi:nucleoside-diphosphate-sugar epimerase
MRIVIIGGSGYVGRLIVPLLAREHTIRVLDPRRPTTPCEHVEGDATDPAALDEALRGADAVVHGAMGTWAAIRPSFDVNVTSVYQTLAAAHRAGIEHLVHFSSLSVFKDVNERHLDESTPPDAVDLYGLTKRLGEEVCRAAVIEHGMSVNVLRLAWPTTDAAWPAWAGEEPWDHWTAPDGTPIHATAATDLARAVLAAQAYRDGFQIFTISGDESARLWSTARARTLLGWAPTFGREAQ